MHCINKPFWLKFKILHIELYQNFPWFDLQATNERLPGWKVKAVLLLCTMCICLLSFLITKQCAYVIESSYSNWTKKQWMETRGFQFQTVAKGQRWSYHLHATAMVGVSISWSKSFFEINCFLRVSRLETYFTQAQEEKAPGKTAHLSSKSY